jgi:WD40 repeat protein
LTAASGSLDTTVRTWNLIEARQESEFKGHTDIIYSIKFLDDKKLLVSAGGDKIVIIWSLTNGTQRAVLNGHKQSICKVLVTDDEKFIISADLIDGIRIWYVDQLILVKQFFHQGREAENWLNDNKIDVNEVKSFLKA